MSSDSEGTLGKWPGEKLKPDTDYDSWLVVASVVFQQFGIDGLVEGVDAAPTPSSSTPTSADITAMAAWKRRDIKAQLIIYSGLNSEMIQVIKSSLDVDSKKRTAKSIFDAVNSHFKPKLIGRTIQLTKDLANRKLQPNEKLIDFFSDIESMVRSLSSALNLEYRVEDLYRYLVPGLPEEYNSKLDILSGIYETGTLTADIMKNQLLEKERQLQMSKANTEEARAFSMKFRKGFRQSGGSSSGNGGSGGGQQRFSPRPQSNNGKQKDFICYNCGKPGHIAKNCGSKKKNQGGYGQSQSGSKASLFMAQIGSNCLRVDATLAKLQMHSSKQRNVQDILFDTGATHTMTWDEKDLENVEDIDAQVLLPGGQSLKVTKIGDLSIAILDADGKATGYFTVPNALLVPDLHVKVFAQVPFGELNYGINGFGLTMDFLDPNGDIVFTVVHDKESNLYKIRGIPKRFAEAQVNLTISDTGRAVNPTILWHSRFGHANLKDIKDTVKVVTGLDERILTAHEPATICGACAGGKQTFKHSAFKAAGERSKDLLDLVHLDLSEMNVVDMNGCKYWLEIVEDHSRYKVAITLKKKSDAKQAYLEWEIWAETSTERKVKTVQFDQGGEFLSNELKGHFKSRGTRFFTSVTDTPQQNGVAENAIKTTAQTARANMIASGLPDDHWGHAVRHASYVKNRIVNGKHGLTPFEKFFGFTPDVSHLRSFGCTAYLKVHDKKRKKLDVKSKKYIMIGYSTEKGQKGYWLYDPETRKIVIGSVGDTIFDEASFLLDKYPQIPEEKFWNSGGEADEVKQVKKVSKQGDIPMPNLLDDPDNDEGSIIVEIPARPRIVKELREPPQEDPDDDEGSIVVEIPARPRIVKEPREQPQEDPLPAVESNAPVTAAPVVEGEGKRNLGNREKSKGSRSVLAEPTRESARLAKGKQAETVQRQRYDLRLADSKTGNTQAPWKSSLNAMALLGNCIVDNRLDVFSDVLGKINLVQDTIPDEYTGAVEIELDRLNKYEFAEIIKEVPKDVEILECRFVLTVKTLKDGGVKYKARLVLRGYQQTFELILAELYSPVGTSESLRYLFANAAENDWEMEQIDFDVAFIQSDPLEEQDRAYVQMPLGIPKFLLDRYGWEEAQILRIIKPLYGHKKAPNYWYKTVSKKMKDSGYTPLDRDSCLFISADKKFLTFVHVDDMIMSGEKGSKKIQEAKEKLKKRFDLREEGYPKLFTGIQVEKLEDGIFIHQTRYTLKVLEEFGELEGKWDKVPLGPNPKVIERLIEESKTPDYEFMKQVQYRELIGAGSWLAKGTRPDILFAISFLSRFQTCFTEAHWKQAKQVFAYLRGTLGWGILYSKNGEGPFKTKSGEIVGFADANWVEITPQSSIRMKR